MTTETLTYTDNRLVTELCGPHDTHLLLVENRLGIRLFAKGNTITLEGDEGARAKARAALDALYARAEGGLPLSMGDVEGALRFLDNRPAPQALAGSRMLALPKRTITARTPTQQDYLDKLAAKELVFGVGPAGTGKTYLAVAQAASLLVNGDVERIILTRPAVEAGERIGFLPGEMKDKLDPYLQPLYDALYDVLHGDYVTRKLGAGEIEIAPIAFMRGRTLSRAAVILDEAQNATIGQMKMFLTRLGEGSRMIVTGDPSQTDLPDPRQSGLADALSLLAVIKGVAITRFTGEDVVRHPLVKEIVGAYDRRAQERIERS